MNKIITASITYTHHSCIKYEMDVNVQKILQPSTVRADKLRVVSSGLNVRWGILVVNTPIYLRFSGQDNLCSLYFKCT